jgi:hypothetical protein
MGDWPTHIQFVYVRRLWFEIDRRSLSHDLTKPFFNTTKSLGYRINVFDAEDHIAETMCCDCVLQSSRTDSGNGGMYLVCPTRREPYHQFDLVIVQAN